MPASDTLNKAAAVILERGHHKGSYEDPHGRGVCLLGALLCVFSGQPGDWQNHEVELDHCTAYLEQVIDDSFVHDWNDRPETTPDMAYGALLEAGLLAKELGD